jgi:hypothetical protein
MLHANYFMILDRLGSFIIGRTDAETCGLKPCVTPEGSPGYMIVVPANYVDVFRTDWIFKNRWDCADLLDKQTSLWLTKTAMLRWIDKRRVQGL